MIGGSDDAGVFYQDTVIVFVDNLLPAVDLGLPDILEIGEQTLRLEAVIEGPWKARSTRLSISHSRMAPCAQPIFVRSVAGHW